MLAFENAYNEQHLRCGTNFVTPASRHRGEECILLAQLKTVYERGKRLHPRRWLGATRNWAAASDVSLNPGKAQRSSTITSQIRYTLLDNRVENYRNGAEVY